MSHQGGEPTGAALSKGGNGTHLNSLATPKCCFSLHHSVQALCESTSVPGRSPVRSEWRHVSKAPVVHSLSDHAMLGTMSPYSVSIYNIRLRNSFCCIHMSSNGYGARIRHGIKEPVAYKEAGRNRLQGANLSFLIGKQASTATDESYS